MVSTTKKKKCLMSASSRGHLVIDGSFIVSMDGAWVSPSYSFDLVRGQHLI